VAQAVQVQVLSPAPIRDTGSQIDDPMATGSLAALGRAQHRPMPNT
jgi:hypothetical protein